MARGMNAHGSRSRREGAIPRLLVAASALVATACAEAQPRSVPAPVEAIEPYAESVRPALKIWSGVPSVGDYDPYASPNLDHLVDRTPDIVYAVVDRIEPGRLLGPPGEQLRSVFFILRVEMVLRSERFRPGDHIRTELRFTYPHVDVSRRFEEALGDEGLFFLNRSGAPQPEIGYEGEPQEFALDLYGLITVSQGVFINNAGRVYVEYPFEGFPANLNGIPFEELMERVRSAMQS